MKVVEGWDIKITKGMYAEKFTIAGLPLEDAIKEAIKNADKQCDARITQQNVERVENIGAVYVY